MGLGDEIMAAGRAQALHRETGRRVVIVDGAGGTRWSQVWEGLPMIVRPQERPGNAVPLLDCGGARPYVSNWESCDGKPRAVYADWKAEDYPASLALSASERARARATKARLGEYIVIEPLVKGTASPNKDWGPLRYQEVVRLLASRYRVVQLGDGASGGMRLAGAVWEHTGTFREAMAVLAGAACLVAPDGGLHHAAAGLRVPAVVIHGHFTAAAVTGYSWHRNLGGEVGCGRWARCAACRAWLDALRPATVAAAVPEAIALNESHWGEERWALLS